MYTHHVLTPCNKFSTPLVCLCVCLFLLLLLILFFKFSNISQHFWHAVAAAANRLCKNSIVYFSSFLERALSLNNFFFQFSSPLSVDIAISSMRMNSCSRKKNDQTHKPINNRLKQSIQSIIVMRDHRTTISYTNHKSSPFNWKLRLKHDKYEIQLTANGNFSASMSHHIMKMITENWQRSIFLATQNHNVKCQVEIES